MIELQFYEILVPNIPTLHQGWDERVIKIAGGLSLQQTIRGKWIDNKKEDMIPVRIACTGSEMYEIALMTKERYNQSCVMYYRISDYVRIV